MATQSRKRARLIAPPVAPTKPLESPPAPPAEYWLRSILTDREGNFDAGAILTCIVVIYMCASSGYTTMTLHIGFDAQSFGTGIGAVLAGFGFYKWGDRPQQGTTTTFRRIERTDAMTERPRD